MKNLISNSVYFSSVKYPHFLLMQWYSIACLSMSSNQGMLLSMQKVSLPLRILSAQENFQELGCSVKQALLAQELFVVTTDMEDNRDSLWPGSFNYTVPKWERCSMLTGEEDSLPVLWQNEECEVYIITLYLKAAFLIWVYQVYMFCWFWQINARCCSNIN